MHRLDTGPIWALTLAPHLAELADELGVDLAHRTRSVTVTIDTDPPAIVVTVDPLATPLADLAWTVAVNLAPLWDVFLHDAAVQLDVTDGRRSITTTPAGMATVAAGAHRGDWQDHTTTNIGGTT